MVPGCLALLPEYASLEDPVEELRAACLAAVAWLGEDVRVVASAQGTRVAASLLAEVGTAPVTSGEAAYLIVANGSACRSEKAPGHLDPRAAGYDEVLGASLTAPDPDALAGLDLQTAEELWADVAPVVEASELLRGATTVAVDYDDDPYGVRYWVARWDGAASRSLSPAP
ncbi:hypothetical protein GCM10010197_41410 [Nocardioides luteus]|uniref:Uncharacterized protein n=2 Tax=Nocardioides luteus TaxID=1844 RepID=A0ABQ5T1G2_9ACTN|nr:hypothetical protein GCM10010197_41410 [Nocardioides luteus]GLJ70315.1 hypothetical protein GCM10017579_43510 [Nocardioides luteus]